jgi:hypothetical protein
LQAIRAALYANKQRKLRQSMLPKPSQLRFGIE